MTDPTPSLPLAGLRVLAVEQYGAGPFGTLFLADQGAEVIKIENPHDGGDMARGVGPHFFGPGDSHFFHAFNRNKSSITLDLGKPQGQRLLHELVGTADALISNLRGDVPQKLGLTYATLGVFNRRIVCAHLSAYGRTGPRAAWPGYDYLMQAEAGYFSLTGEVDGPPSRFGLSMVDLMTGLGLAYATLTALIAARSSGIGRDIDVSLFDMALFNLGYLANWYLNCGVNTARLPRSAHPSLTPCQLYRTRDDWIYIMCNKEKFWPLLCREIGRPEWAQDSRLATFAARLEHRDLITELLDGVFGQADTATWLERLGGRVPAAPVYDVAQALDNPFVTGHGRLQALTHDSGVPYRMVSPPIATEGLTAPARPAPDLGQNTDAVFGALGYSASDLAKLRADGVI
ncbi:MAG: CoA transferase [Gammaproteobacteria bacterium]|nr:CoA transferase [Gammaproteobacteria bacterium]